MTTPGKTPEEIKLDEDCKKVIATKCYYEVLRIQKTATQEEIKKAYKKVSKRIISLLFVLILFLYYKIYE